MRCLGGCMCPYSLNVDITLGKYFARRCTCSYLIRHRILHYTDVIMTTMVSQITSLTVVYFKRLFRRRAKKTSKLCVTGLCVGNSPGPVNSLHKGPVTRKMFPFDDVIMYCNMAYQTTLNTSAYWFTVDQRKYSIFVSQSNSNIQIPEKCINDVTKTIESWTGKPSFDESFRIAPVSFVVCIMSFIHDCNNVRENVGNVGISEQQTIHTMP